MAARSKGRSAAARLLRLWTRIPPGAWMFVCCECCVLAGRDACDELITRLEECYWLWCVVVCDLETSWMRRPFPTGAIAPNKKIRATYRGNTKCVSPELCTARSKVGSGMMLITAFYYCFILNEIGRIVFTYCHKTSDVGCPVSEAYRFFIRGK